MHRHPHRLNSRNRADSFRPLRRDKPARSGAVVHHAAPEYLSAMPNPFTEFRKDGWPLCPRCEEDELYSLYLMTSHGIARQITEEEIPLLELLGYPFRCYHCNWSNDNGSPLLAMLTLTGNANRFEVLADSR